MVWDRVAIILEGMGAMIDRLFGRTSPPPLNPAAVTVTVTSELHAAEVYHDAARHFLDVQLTTLDSLSTKTT